ncbi:MAG: response regulator transcription factor [Acidobacteria bacterium]|nr:response regulator transcription factor [Acidobacteriota bacterium]
MSKPIRLVVADDSHFAREALRHLLAKESSIELAAEARSGEEALALIEQYRPDVVLLDISMDKPDAGFEVARQLRQRKSPAKVLFWSGQDYSDALLREFVHRALELGAAGFIVKSVSSDEIIDAIKTAGGGQRHFSSSLTKYLLDLRDGATAIEARFPSLRELGETDYRILLLLAEAKTSKEIAAELQLSPRTVENHLNDLRDKLDLKGHHHLMKFAIEHKTDLLAAFSSRE